MKKQSLVFDASVIAENLVASSGRSGIFFAAYNILDNIIKSDEFDVSLFCQNICDEKFVDFAHNHFGNDINIIFGNKYSKVLKKLSDLDQKLRVEHRNILKLLLNIFVRKPVKIFGKINKAIHCDIFISPLRIVPNKIKSKQKYIILYDAIPLLFPQYYPEMNLKKYWYYDLVQYIKRKPMCKYFAISENTKKDFIKLLDVNQDDIVVIPLAANDNFYQEKDVKKIKKVCSKYNIPNDKKYVFSLCTLEPRKNLIRAVKTFIEFIKKNKINDMVFVLGGAHWDSFIKKLESEIKDLGEYKDKIIRAGYIDDNDLAALYSGAEFFVYTSQYEGFGLPPLEAMQCGCPVITSNNSSLPEVVGDTGIIIDWDSDEQHISAYEKYYFDKDYREQQANKGLERSRAFSWQKTVDIIVDTIKRNINVKHSVQTKRNR